MNTTTMTGPCFDGHLHPAIDGRPGDVLRLRTLVYDENGYPTVESANAVLAKWEDGRPTRCNMCG